MQYRGGGFVPEHHRWVGLLVFIILIAIAEIGTQTGFISNLTLPKPSDILISFGELYSSGLLWKHLLPSLSRLAVDSIVGISLGISVGIAIGLFSYVRAGLVPLVANDDGVCVVRRDEAAQTLKAAKERIKLEEEKHKRMANANWAWIYIICVRSLRKKA